MTISVALPVLLGLAFAQSPPEAEIRAQDYPYIPPNILALRAQVELVEVPTVVRDSHHRAVAGLTRDNFEISDAGKIQTITSFSVQGFAPRQESQASAAPSAADRTDSPRPRFVTLLFDNLNTGNADLKPAKDAAQRFIATSLAPGDRVAVATTAATDTVEFTGDLQAVASRIAKVTAQPGLAEGGGPMCPSIRPIQAYLLAYNLEPDLLKAKVAEYLVCYGPATHPEDKVRAFAYGIWEQVSLNSRQTLAKLGNLVDGMAKLNGERMILLTSGGFLTGSLEYEQETLMSKALHEEVVINTLDAKGVYTVVSGGDASTPPALPVVGRSRSQTESRPGADDARRQFQSTSDAKNDSLATLAAGTGGAFYHNSNDLLRGFRELGMVPETLYVLGFTPSDVAPDGRFHRLKVRLKSPKGYSLQSRLGYTAPTATASATAPPSKLDNAVTASEAISDLPVKFSWEQAGTAPEVTLSVHLDVGRLHFENKEDRRRQTLTVVSVLMDSRGGLVAGKRTEVTLDLTPATYTKLVQTGVRLKITLPGPPGTYSARAAAQEGLDGKIAAASGAVEVR